MSTQVKPKAKQLTGKQASKCLRAWRNHWHLTGVFVARQLDVHKMTIIYWEGSKSQWPTRERLERVNKLLLANEI